VKLQGRGEKFRFGVDEFWEDSAGRHGASIYANQKGIAHQRSSLMGSAMQHACGFFKTNRMLMSLPCHPATLPPCHL